MAYYSESSYCVEEARRPYAEPGFYHGEGGESYAVIRKEYKEVDEVAHAGRGHYGHGHGHLVHSGSNRHIHGWFCRLCRNSSPCSRAHVRASARGSGGMWVCRDSATTGGCPGASAIAHSQDRGWLGATTSPMLEPSLSTSSSMRS